MKTTTIHHEIFGNLEVIQEGEKVFFPATEVATLLGYENPQKAIRDHCLPEGVNESFSRVQTGKKSDGSPAFQEVKKKYITEGNLYRLIVRSKLPQAVAFERWVFDEVLPQLRKEGLYMTQSTAEEAISDPEVFLARALVLAGDKIKSLENRLGDAQEAQEFIEKFVEAKEFYTIRETVKLFGIGERIFIRILRDKGFLYHINGGRLLPNREIVHRGYAKIKIGRNPFTEHHYHQTLFTSKGIEWLSRLLKEVVTE